MVSFFSTGERAMFRNHFKVVRFFINSLVFSLGMAAAGLSSGGPSTPLWVWENCRQNTQLRRMRARLSRGLSASRC